VAGEWVDKEKAPKTPGTQSAKAYFGVVFPEDDEEDAWLRDVEEDGPAAKAGLKPGDTLTKFNDKAVKSVKEFRKLLAASNPGDKVKITARRGTNLLSVTVTLAKRT
jgi:S1-C subfamily serine protease